MASVGVLLVCRPSVSKSNDYSVAEVGIGSSVPNFFCTLAILKLTGVPKANLQHRLDGSKFRKEQQEFGKLVAP